MRISYGTTRSEVSRRVRAALAGAVAASAVAVPAHGQRADTRRAIIEHPLPFESRRDKLTLDYIRAHYDSAARTIRITPRMIVIHATETPSLDSTLRLFEPAELPASRPDIARGGALNVAAHYLVDRDGTILRLLPDTVMARHTIGLNRLAIGIENVGGGPYGPLTAQQLAADRWLVRRLVDAHPTIRYLIGHCEYGRFRGTPLWEERDPTYITPKQDPGAAFMERLRRAMGPPALADHFLP
jgi:N-acetyl-anhydromuramyl-L-alanine amidase AmpD